MVIIDQEDEFVPGAGTRGTDDHTLPGKASIFLHLEVTALLLQILQYMFAMKEHWKTCIGIVFKNPLDLNLELFMEYALVMKGRYGC